MRILFLKFGNPKAFRLRIMTRLLVISIFKFVHLREERFCLIIHGGAILHKKAP